MSKTLNVVWHTEIIRHGTLNIFYSNTQKRGNIKKLISMNCTGYPWTPINSKKYKYYP